jgi:hypothetical protein
MKNCLLIISILVSFVSITFSQSDTRENSSLNSTVYFKFNSFKSQSIAGLSLLNSDLSINESNLELVINHLTNSILTDSLKSEINTDFVVTRDDYNNMSTLKKAELNNFIESLHMFVDALEPIQYPKKLGYFLPDNEIESLLNILELN